MPQVITPSSVIISDPSTLVQNYTQNAQRVFCQAANDAGRLAILGFVTGIGAAVPQAFLGLGALGVLGAATCQDSFDPAQIVPEPPPFTGGQCPVQYNVTYRVVLVNVDSCAVVQDITGTVGVMGPVSVETVLTGADAGTSCGGPPRRVPQKELRIKNGSGTVVQSFQYYDLPPSNASVLSVARADGQPDNCGNLPGEGGQIITNITEGDYIDNSTVVDNSQNTYVAETTFDFSGSQFTVNMPFSNIQIDSLLPLNFSIEIGGVRFGFGQDPDNPEDPTLKPKPVNPTPIDPSQPKQENKELIELLKQIKDCVCAPDIDLDMLFVPFVDEEIGCEIQTKTLLIPQGSITPGEVQKLQDSALLAADRCADNSAENTPESLLYSGATTASQTELFSPILEAEVRSVRLIITGINNNSVTPYRGFPGADQRKFGSINFALDGISGGGDSVFVYDRQTYYQLPKHSKEGRIRLLLRPGISFELYDTGERFI